MSYKAAQGGATGNETDEDRIKRVLQPVPRKSMAETLDKTVDKSGTVRQLLHGPLMQEASRDALIRVMDELRLGERMGNTHQLWMRYQREAVAQDPALSGDPLGVNFVIPRIIVSDSERPYLSDVVILSNVDDCSRIAREHVRKQPNFTPIFFQSLIAATDNEHWANQRSHLNEVFIPNSSLAKIFPTSLARAKGCAQHLEKLAAEAGPYGVQMHEFYLNEAMAQLQLALFGMDEKYMEATNKRVRSDFNGTAGKDEGFAIQMCMEMIQKVKSDPRFATASEEAVKKGSKCVFGPMSKAIDNASTELNLDVKDQFGNMLLVLFAGHDTTAHTMTWLTYELARHPEYQRRLQKEVDDLMASLGGRNMCYGDFVKMPFLTRCVMETLRLWTAVPNGTFRQLQHDDEVTGPGGKKVMLPKGTHIQIVNWMRHRDPALWGEDVNEFKPDRDFRDNEIWGGGYHGSNPASPRFSPFTFAPRDCLGKNFAQMEMRAILSHVFHKFSFELSEPYRDEHVAKHGPIENVVGTMGPRDLTPEALAATQKRSECPLDENAGPIPLAMYLRVVPRAPSSRL
jgi:cytochrome P450